MTNRERIAEDLKNKNELVTAYLMCPYIPGEKGAGCNDPELATFLSDCMPCINRWLDQEEKDDSQ